MALNRTGQIEATTIPTLLPLNTLEVKLIAPTLNKVASVPNTQSKKGVGDISKFAIKHPSVNPIMEIGLKYAKNTIISDTLS